MTDEERKQEAFREEMRGYISADKKALESLADRVTQLEKTVIHGNGNPPLIGQITELKTKMDLFSRDVSDLKKEVSSISELKAEIAAMKTELRDEIKNRAFSAKNWIAVGIMVFSVVLTEVVQYIMMVK